MTSVSISKLKKNPSAAIALAEDFPVAIEKRNKTKAYIVSKDVYEKIISVLEDNADSKTVKNTDL